MKAWDVQNISFEGAALDAAMNFYIGKG